MTEFLIGLAIGAAGTLVLITWLVINRSWRHARFAGARIPWPVILGMRLRGTPATLIVDAYVSLIKRGRTVAVGLVEAVYLAHHERRLDSGALVALVEHQLGKDAA